MRHHDQNNHNNHNNDHTHGHRFHHDGSGREHDAAVGFTGLPGRGFSPGFGGPGFGPGFGPGSGPRGRRRAGKGDIRSVIVSLLAGGPSNGYGLIQAIAERTGGAWRPSPGSVYPTLQQLVDEELIAANGDGRRTEYELTDAGRTFIDDHAEELKAAWEATPAPSAGSMTLHESIHSLMGVVHQYRSAATEEQKLAAAKKLDETRKALYLILAE